jgi:hypothetical protein
MWPPLVLQQLDWEEKLHDAVAAYEKSRETWSTIALQHQKSTTEASAMSLTAVPRADQ